MMNTNKNINSPAKRAMDILYKESGTPSKENPVTSAVNWLKDKTGNPLVAASLLGLTTWGLGRLAWGPVIETIRSLGRPFHRDPRSAAEWEQDMDYVKETSKAKTWLPILGALAAAGGASYLFYKPNQEWGGMLDWNAPNKPLINNSKYEWDNRNFQPKLVKAASYSDMYMQDIDWNQPVNLGVARSLFTPSAFNNGFDGARLTGASIVNNAAIQQGTMHPTLGAVYDSAIDKIDKNLSFGGLMRAGVKATVANGAARLFTGALGAVCDLSPKTRQSLLDAGTWAGAITSILS